VNFGTSLQPPKYRTTVERTSDSDKFDTLLMLATERTNRLDRLYKQQQLQHHRRFSSTSPHRRPVPLVIIEQQTSNHHQNIRPQHVRFTSAGIFYFC
jgi:hypothetical protein